MKAYPLMLGAIAACGDSTPDAIEYDEVAQIVGATIATPDGGATVGAVLDSRMLAVGGMPAGFTYENGVTHGNHGTLEHRYMMVQCRDRHDQLLPKCTADTNLATVVAAWSGKLHQPGLDIRSNRQGMWTLSNLVTWMPVVTGSSSLQSEATFASGHDYEMIADETEAMLAPIAMMGGTIHLDLHVTRGSMQHEITADIVFDAAMQSASLTLDDTLPYRVDLATGLVEDARRHDR